MRGHTLHDGGA